MNCSHDSMNWDKSVQPLQKKLLDGFMEKYNLQDQDRRKQMKKWCFLLTETQNIFCEKNLLNIGFMNE